MDKTDDIPGRGGEQWVARDGGVTLSLDDDSFTWNLDEPIPLMPNDYRAGEVTIETAAAVAAKLDQIAAEFNELARRLRRQASVIRYTGRVYGLT